MLRNLTLRTLKYSCPCACISTQIRSHIGEWSYSSIHSYPPNWTELYGPFHTRLALPPYKQPLIFTEEQASCGPEPIWMLW